MKINAYEDDIEIIWPSCIQSVSQQKKQHKHVYNSHEKLLHLNGYEMESIKTFETQTLKQKTYTCEFPSF